MPSYFSLGYFQQFPLPLLFIYSYYTEKQILLLTSFPPAVHCLWVCCMMFPFILPRSFVVYFLCCILSFSLTFILLMMSCHKTKGFDQPALLNPPTCHTAPPHPSTELLLKSKNRSTHTHKHPHTPTRQISLTKTKKRETKPEGLSLHLHFDQHSSQGFCSITSHV